MMQHYIKSLFTKIYHESFKSDRFVKIFMAVVSAAISISLLGIVSNITIKISESEFVSALSEGEGSNRLRMLLYLLLPVIGALLGSVVGFLLRKKS